MGLLGDSLGVLLWTPQEHLGDALGTLWGLSGDTLGTLWGCFGDTEGSMGTFGGYFGDTLGTLQEHPRDTLGSPWGHFVNTSETPWGHFGDTLGALWGFLGDPTLYPHDPTGPPPPFPLPPPLPYLLAQRSISAAFRPYRPIAEHTGTWGGGGESRALLHNCVPLHECSLLHACRTHTRLHASVLCSQASPRCKNGNVFSALHEGTLCMSTHFSIRVSILHAAKALPAIKMAVCTFHFLQECTLCTSKTAFPYTNETSVCELLCCTGMHLCTSMSYEHCLLHKHRPLREHKTAQAHDFAGVHSLAQTQIFAQAHKALHKHRPLHELKPQGVTS